MFKPVLIKYVVFLYILGQEYQMKVLQFKKIVGLQFVDKKIKVFAEVQVSFY